MVIPERRSAAVTAAACKASAGAVEHLAVARVRNLADWLGEAREAGLLGLGGRRRGADPLQRRRPEGGTVLVLGGEGKGLRPRVAGGCDGLVAIPQRGEVGVAERLRGGRGAALRGACASAAEPAPSADLGTAVARRDCSGARVDSVRG